MGAWIADVEKHKPIYYKIVLLLLFIFSLFSSLFEQCINVIHSTDTIRVCASVIVLVLMCRPAPASGNHMALNWNKTSVWIWVCGRWSMCLSFNTLVVVVAVAIVT